MAGLSFLHPHLLPALKATFGTEEVFKIYLVKEEMTETIIMCVYYFIIKE